MAPENVRCRAASATGVRREPKYPDARSRTSSGVAWVRWKYFTLPSSRFTLFSIILVILDAQVRNLLLTHQVSEGVLQLGLLDEEIVLGIQARSHLRALEVEREPLLDAAEPGPLRQVEEQRQVEHQR